MESNFAFKVCMDRGLIWLSLGQEMGAHNTRIYNEGVFYRKIIYFFNFLNYQKTEF